MRSRLPSMAASHSFQATLKQLAACLLGVAVIPPVMWAAISEPMRRWLTQSLSEDGALLVSTTFVALGSGMLALGLWVFVFLRPLRLIRRMERKLQSLAMRDALTGLLNREGLLLALNHAIDHKKHQDGGLGLVLLDLDKFRLINSSMGEIIGDVLLEQAAQRMQSVVRSSDLVARLGGDRFAILVTGSSGVHGLYIMARNLQRAFAEPFPIDGRTALLTPTLGISVYGESSVLADELITCAEAAIRSGKSHGGARISRFDPGMQVDADRQIEVNVRLREALRHSEFKLLYQPVMAADGLTIATAEALLRWVDPVRGVVSPGEFIPVLEQTGLITQVGHWVLLTACERGSEWIESGSPDLVISVNVSPRQFAEANFVESVCAVLDQTGFPAGQLQLEITEGILLDPTREVMQKLKLLSEMGIRLALDDFGMGYSSLAYLKMFPLHTLKIDRNFVKDLPGTDHDDAIAQAVVALGHGLGLHVTAEGVETAEQFDLLVSMGCDSFQGFLFARPLEVEDLTQRLRASRDAVMSLPQANRVLKAEPQPFRISAVRRRVRVLRNGELLGESLNAQRLIEGGLDSEPGIYLPRQDVKVKLSDSGVVGAQRHSGERNLGERRFLDLLGRQNQVVSQQIAWAFSDATGRMAPLGDCICFVADQVTIEESPVDS
ncbi:MAG: putative bifunctional diguanylate cyclase/phosphodiesterase [Burkholderiaceae bacterium]